MRAFAWFLGLVLVGLAALAVFSYPAWLLLHPHFDFPFHRIGERIGMLVLLAGFLLSARHLRLNDRASLGYGCRRRIFAREMSIGFALGVLSMLAVVGIMNALGLLEWSPAARFSAAALLGLALLRLLSALAVAFIEETLIRGAMLTAIEREAGARVAIVLTALVYAASHFLASFHIPAQQVSAWSGLDLLTGTLHSFAHPAGIADAFLCLLAVGVVLGMIRVMTGHIAACVGLHAGWVWVMLLAHEMSAPLRAARFGFLLSSFDGFVGWLVLGWTIVLGFALRRFYARYASGARTSSL